MIRITNYWNRNNKKFQVIKTFIPSLDGFVSKNRVLKKSNMEKLKYNNYINFKLANKLYFYTNLNYLFNLNSYTNYYNILMGIANKPLIDLSKITVYKGVLANYRDNYGFLNISKKPRFMVLDKTMVLKNFKTLNALLVNLFRLNYSFVFFGGIKFGHELTSLNYYNGSAVLKHILNRSLIPSMVDYFTVKLNQIPNLVVFSIDQTALTKVVNLNIMIFNFLNLNKKNHSFFYTILIDISFYFNTFLVIQYLHSFKILGINLRILNYLNVYNYYKSNIKLT